MKEIYLLKVDTICKKCGYRNREEYTLESEIDTICCGNCGEFLCVSEDYSEEEKETTKQYVKQAIEKGGDQDDVL